MHADRYLLLLLLLSTFLIPCRGDGPLRAEEEEEEVEGGGLPFPHEEEEEDNGITARGDAPVPGRELHTPSARTAELLFVLKVFVMDSLSRQPLAGASVGVYVNHTLRSPAQADAAGEALLWLPYRPELSLTLIASIEGYVPAQLPWRTLKRPVFSSVTMQLLPHSQGNIWLFEDSVLIAGKTPGCLSIRPYGQTNSSSQPSVKFPKNLLPLSGTNNVSSVMAYLTVPQHHLARDCGNCTQGIIGSSKSVYRTVELRPVAAVSALLFAGSVELQVRGPIQISLPLSHPTNLRPSDTVPAWAFNLNTGAWETKGLGIVKMIQNRLVWTYTASHLGYWIAAPMPSSSDYMGHHPSSWDFMSFHTYLLVGILGGTLVVMIGFLSVLLCHCSASYQEPRRRSRARRRGHFTKMAAVKQKDQTTSTHPEEGNLLFQAGDCAIQCEPPLASSSSATPRHRANYNIYVEDPGGRPGAAGGGPLYENMARIREASGGRWQGNASPGGLFFQDKLVHVCSQPLGALQAQEHPGAAFSLSNAPGDDCYANALPKAQTDEPQPLETPPPPGPGPKGGAGTPWGRYNNNNSLLESSVSAPGTLNEAAGVAAELQGISERALLELARGKPSSAHPRAWFVSLDGKPAAQVRHSIIELHSRRRPASSNDTSLDSGVDMSEQSDRDHRSRDRPRASSSLPGRGRGRWGGGGGGIDEHPLQQQDLSSSESGTAATCTPEDSSLRSILDEGGIPNIPEERDGTDSESRGTPTPPRRPRKGREKGRAEKRSVKNGKNGGRPLTNRS